MLYAETIKGGRYKIEDSSPINLKEMAHSGDTKIIMHSKKDSSALSPKLPDIMSTKRETASTTLTSKAKPFAFSRTRDMSPLQTKLRNF